MRRSIKKNLIFACTFAACGWCDTPYAHAETVVVPNGLSTAEGNMAAPNATDPRRVMQVYDASHFSTVGMPLLISKLTLRPASAQQGPGTLTDFNLRTSLSTTGRSPETISTVFEENIGPDYMQVASSNTKTFTTANLPGPGNTRQFDVVVPFDEPFLYDSSVGNLLLEFQVGPPDTNGQIVFDFAAGDPAVNMVAAFGSPTATTGEILGMGFVTQFTYQPIPEPSSFVLLGLSLLSICISWPRKRT